MTTIGSVGGPSPPRSSSRSAAPTRSSFAVPSEADPGVASAGTASAAAPAAALGSMLALQEQDAETVEDRTARRHGSELLGVLAELQRALLGGDGDLTALQRVVELTQDVPIAADPRLAAVLSAITLRARVELARRGI